MTATGGIDHVTIRVTDAEASRAFYDRALELVGYDGERYAGGGFYEWNDFSLTNADADHPVTRRLHLAFAAESHEQVDRWWRELTRAGHVDDGRPGPRREYGLDYYGAFVLDPDGNSVEAVLHDETTREPGLLDHLWIRVRDLARTRRFYAAVAGPMGLTLQELPGRVQVAANGSTFSFLPGEPTAGLHLAVGVLDEDTVRAFHRTGLDAGGRDNGGPGERPEYHPGYYGAFLLDPDGSNIEAVHHGRR